MTITAPYIAKAALYMEGCPILHQEPVENHLNLQIGQLLHTDMRLYLACDTFVVIVNCGTMWKGSA